MERVDEIAGGDDLWRRPLGGRDDQRLCSGEPVARGGQQARQRPRGRASRGRALAQASIATVQRGCLAKNFRI
jgi:hypothetical protein